MDALDGAAMAGVPCVVAAIVLQEMAFAQHWGRSH